MLLKIKQTLEPNKNIEVKMVLTIHFHYRVCVRKKIQQNRSSPVGYDCNRQKFI